MIIAAVGIPLVVAGSIDQRNTLENELGQRYIRIPAIVNTDSGETPKVFTIRPE